MRATLLGALGALALMAGAAAAWQTLGPLGVALTTTSLGLVALLALRRDRILEALPAPSMPRAMSLKSGRRTPIVLGVSLAVGIWLGATVFALTSLSENALPPSGARVAELETNVDGLVAAVGLLGGGDGAAHDDGPPLTPSFPVAGAEPTTAATPTASPASTPAFLPTLEATSTPAASSTATSTPSTSFDFATPSATASSTPAAGATPSPLSQPRVSSGPGGGPLDTSGANLYNCTDFDTWEQAVAVFRASGEADPNFLDTDGNGIPCEDLKAAELSRG